MVLEHTAIALAILYVYSVAAIACTLAWYPIRTMYIGKNSRTAETAALATRSAGGRGGMSAATAKHSRLV